MALALPVFNIDKLESVRSTLLASSFKETLQQLCFSADYTYQLLYTFDWPFKLHRPANNQKPDASWI